MTRSDPASFALEPPQKLASGVLLQRQFRDADELASYVLEGRVKITQLSLQPFLCKSMVLNLDVVRFSFNRTNAAVSVLGEKTSGFFTFVVLPHGIERPIVSHGQLITDGWVFGFDPNRGIDLVFPAHSTHCAVSIRQDVFESCAQAMDRVDLNDVFLARNYCYLPDRLGPLQTYLDQLYTLLRQKHLLLQQPKFQQLVLRDFLPLLVSVLPMQQDQSKIKMKHLQRSHLVKQVNNYMLDNLDRPLTLSDLSHALHTSCRAISYGFQDIFGMSPMAYLKTLRLQSVHRALRQADPHHESIINIANRYGFWSLNHFSKDYKTMFGETPSVTLNKVSG